MAAMQGFSGFGQKGRMIKVPGQFFIDLLPQIDRLRSRLDKFIWQLRSAMQGYTGFFDLVRGDDRLGV